MIVDRTARPPGPAEVVVRVHGIALGVEPRAEVSGTVVEAGAAAADWVGRRVVVPRVLPCGDCERCRRGRAASCALRAPREGLATVETVPARYLCSLEPPLWPAGAGVPLELWQLAALADAVAAPYGALVRAGLSPNELVVVIGGGPRALFAVAVAQALGAHAAVVTSHAGEAERARALGARVVTDADGAPEETRATVERAAEALGIATVAYKILETTASAAGRHRALAMAPEGGTVLFLDGGEDLPQGATHAPPAPWELLARGEVQLVGASACHPDLYPELCALVAKGALPIGQLVTRVEPADAEAAIRQRRAGRILGLPVVALA